MRLKNLSIKWKLFFFFALFAVIMLALLWFFQIAFLGTFYRSSKVRQIKSAADVIARYINDGDLGDYVENLSVSEQMCILILGPQGETLYSQDALQDCLIHRTSRDSILIWYGLAQENEGSWFETYTREIVQTRLFNIERFTGEKNPDATESMVYVRIAQNDRGEPVIILLNTTVSPVSATVSTLRSQMLYITLIMILLAFLLALIISRTIAQPVIRINESAKRLAKGDYETRFEADGYREIVQLSDTLNTAAFELSRVEELRRELIANVSHDLRTPLTMITGYAEVIRDLPGENSPENAQVIIDEAARLTRLVSDLMDLSRLQSGADRMNPAVFNLTKSVREAIARFSLHLETNGGNIVFSAESDIYVSADEIQISQVIYNLIANAVTHSPQGASIAVRQIPENRRVRIEVADNGPGIPPEQIPHIWERYYKVDKTHKRAQIGSGLGLSIVKGVLERHGADFGVDSAPGIGSTFWFSLPIAEPDDGTQEDAQSGV